MPKKNNDENPLKSYAKYSSIAFKMGIIIFLGVWGGSLLDKMLNFNTPVCTIILSLLSVALAIYVSIKDFLKM